MPKAPAATKAAAAPPPAEAPAETPEATEEPTKGRGEGHRAPKVTPPSSLGSLSTLEESTEYINGLWWGPEGTGKTTDVLTAANLGRVLVVNAEGGAKRKPLREFGIDIGNIVLWPDREHTDVEIHYETLDALYWQVKAELLADPGSWFAVVWDSSSDIYTQFVADVRAYEYERNKRLPAGKQKDYRDDPFFTDRADYGIATEQMRMLLRRFRDLPCHFLVTALERRDIDEETSKVVYGPAVGPAFQKDLLAYLDVVLAAKCTAFQHGPDDELDVTDSFRALTHTNGKSRAKDRLRSVPRIMSDPTFERVLAYVEDRLSEADDPVQVKYREAKLEHDRWTGKVVVEDDGEEQEEAKAS